MAARLAAPRLVTEQLDSATPAEERREALRRLHTGELQILFAVDLFNEGLDIPSIDTVLLLHPTESAVVFLQQLGRGLRLSPETGKCCLTVLDFIGQPVFPVPVRPLDLAVLVGHAAVLRVAITPRWVQSSR
jgi:superfamily II DNA or RNA helicase